MSVEIQILQLSADGKTPVAGWSTVQIVENQDLNIQNALCLVKQNHPNCKVRAVDQSTKRLIDIA